MANSPVILRTTRGLQKNLFAPPGNLSIISEPKGAVYTKRWVVELLLDLAGYTSDANLAEAVAVEPAAGNGAFLGPMISRLVACCSRLGHALEHCENSLRAYEVDFASAERARAVVNHLLTSLAVDPAVAAFLSKSWVRTEDYLLEQNSVEADFVVGNPPYVRLEEIPAETALHYRDLFSTMRGRADLYVAFFEAALSQLKENGVCAFICADRWMRNQYGSHLRELITSAFSVDAIIEMHGAEAFEHEVDAYPAITIIRRKQQGPVVVASAGPETVLTNSKTLSTMFQAAAKDNLRIDHRPGGLSATLVEKWFTGSAPWPCNSPAQLALLRKLEEQFEPLECSARVGIGVATGNDKVFITKEAKLVEPSRLVKLALAQDIADGRMQWSGHYLVDPWNSKGLVDLVKFPRLKNYFEAHATALKKRHTAANNKQGWYKTIDRVTHALTAMPKLYIADIKDVLNPVLDTGETYPHHNLYFLQSDQWDLEVLGALLMSAIGQFFVASYGVKMRGGYWRFQAQYLRRIRLPRVQDISTVQANEMRECFRRRDRGRATLTALAIYGIDQLEWERAIESR